MATKKKITKRSLEDHYNSQNSVVKVGLVQLNKVSQYLTDLPDEAQAELFVSPKSTAMLFGRDIDTFNQETKSIRDIDERHGIHHKGQALKGMQIFDRPKDAPKVTYQEAWANKVRQAWQQAKDFGESVNTDLAIGTKELVHGRKISARDITVANNMYSRIEAINAMLAQQGGEQIISQCRSGSNAHWQFTSAELPYWSRGLYSIDFSDGGCDASWDLKGSDISSSRPVALRVLAPHN